MEITHFVNIAIHITAGTMALILGLAAIVVRKGSKKHARYGKHFMRLTAAVILTALFGIFVFQRNTFLLVLTLLSGYNCYSGIRVLQLAGARPKVRDHVAAVVVTSVALYYLYYLQSIGYYWSPVIVYSTIAALFLVTVYDLLKIVLPVRVLKNAMLYEHAYKMVSAWSAMLSAFSGTVLSQYKPYSQLLPSVACTVYIIFIFVQLGGAHFSLRQKSIHHQTN